MITHRIKDFKIEIGSHPVTNKEFGEDIKIENYDVFVNVSDSPIYSFEGKEVYWCPINEFGTWGYSVFYWFVHVMNRAIKEKKRIYVHCFAGAHRSPMMVYLYIRSLGYSKKDTLKIFDNGDDWIEIAFTNDINAGRIQKDIIEFMKVVHENPQLGMYDIFKKRDKFEYPNKSLVKVRKRTPITKEQIRKKLLF